MKKILTLALLMLLLSPVTQSPARSDDGSLIVGPPECGRTCPVGGEFLLK